MVEREGGPILQSDYCAQGHMLKEGSERDQATRVQSR
jgi:hypothetical protein